MIRFYRPAGIGAALLLISAAILFPVFARARENARRSSCQSNLKQISLGMLQYQQDYYGYFPPVAGAPKSAVEAAQKAREDSVYNAPSVPLFGWVDRLDPYIRSTQIYQCPSEENISAPKIRVTSQGYSDYWMNGRLSGFNSEKLASSAQVITLGDGDSRDTNSTARYSKSSIVIQSQATQNPWTERHLEGANYAFADGHVMWRRVDRISTKSGADYTFAPK